MFRLATRLGVFYPCMSVASLHLVLGNADLASMGLGGILDNDMAFLKDGSGAWKPSFPVRSHARALSMTRGQPRHYPMLMHGKVQHEALLVSKGGV